MKRKVAAAHSPRKKVRNKPGRPVGGRSLTPERVAQAALQLIDSEGLEALSMRRLGQALGVEAMALYNHFADKEAILDAVASLVLASVPVPSRQGPWKSRIKALCSGVRTAALRNPNLFRVVMTRPSPPAAGVPLIDATVAAFADAGLKPELQAAAYHLCFIYVRGFCLWEIEEYSRKPSGAELEAMALQFPRAAAATKWISTEDADRQFARGIEIILRGLIK